MYEPPRDKNGLTEEEYLARYDPSRFDRPSVAVDVVIFSLIDGEPEDVRILLVKRGGHPFLGKWALPGGFVDINESLDDAALRELREETGLKDVCLEQLYTWGDVDRDPRMRVISVSYLALVDASTVSPTPGDDAADARWFNVKQTTVKTKSAPPCNIQPYVSRRWDRIDFRDGEEAFHASLVVTTEETGLTATQVHCSIDDPGGLAFDHARIIHYALERLKSKTR